MGPIGSEVAPNGLAGVKSQVVRGGGRFAGDGRRTTLGRHGTVLGSWFMDE